MSKDLERAQRKFLLSSTGISRCFPRVPVIYSCYTKVDVCCLPNENNADISSVQRWDKPSVGRKKMERRRRTFSRLVSQMRWRLICQEGP